MADVNLHGIVADMQKELKESGALENPTWCSWYVLKSVPVPDDENGVTIDFVVNPCKYKSDIDGHLYYSIDSVVDIDGGDSICEHDWDFTEDCKSSSLRKLLQEHLDVMTDEEMLSMYRAYMAKIGA